MSDCMIGRCERSFYASNMYIFSLDFTMMVNIKQTLTMFLPRSCFSLPCFPSSINESCYLQWINTITKFLSFIEIFLCLNVTYSKAFFFLYPSAPFVSSCVCVSSRRIEIEIRRHRFSSYFAMWLSFCLGDSIYDGWRVKSEENVEDLL